MKKALAFLLAATVCLGLLAACGKSASPYLPYSDTIRLDTPKDELIELEGLVVDESATNSRSSQRLDSEKDDTYYIKTEPVHIRYEDFSAQYTFRGDKLYNFSASCFLDLNSQNFSYKNMVEYFTKLYGEGTVSKESPAPTIYTKYEATSWDFSIDTGAEYLFWITSAETDTLGPCINIFVLLKE